MRRRLDDLGADDALSTLDLILIRDDFEVEPLRYRRVSREPEPARTAKLMLTHGSEEMFRFELDRLIGSLDRRLAEQRKHIAALQAADASVNDADARLRLLRECRSKLLAMRGNFAAPSQSGNHRH